MRTIFATLLAAVLLAVAGCADDEGAGGASGRSGVSGIVHLGPQCPVVVEGEPCDDEPAVGATVTVSEQLPGEAYAAGAVVATATTDDRGAFRVALEPGAYVVTADAGMSCELMDVTVRADAYAAMDVPCDTGIR